MEILLLLTPYLLLAGGGAHKAPLDETVDQEAVKEQMKQAEQAQETQALHTIRG